MFMLNAVAQGRGSQTHKTSGGEDGLDKGPALCPIGWFWYVSIPLKKLHYNTLRRLRRYCGERKQLECQGHGKTENKESKNH